MSWFSWWYGARLRALEERMNELEASNQQQIDDVTAQLQGVESNVGQLQSNIADSAAKLQSEIDSLAQSGGTPPANLDALRAIADELNQHVQTAEQAASDIGSIQPSQPGPASAAAAVPQPNPLGVGTPDNPPVPAQHAPPAETEPEGSGDASASEEPREESQQ